MAKKPNISVLLVGSDNEVSNDLLGPILNFQNINFSIICSNVLDYELPPKIENGATFWYRHELRGIVKLLNAGNFQISESLRDLLKENDRHGLTDLDLAVTNHINQIEQNSASLEQVYDLLVKEIKVSNVTLHPLISEYAPLFAFKNKKYAPLRFYYETGELLKEEPPIKLDKTKRKYEDKLLVIENYEQLKTVKQSERSHKAMNQSDLILIIPTDIVSFMLLLKSTELENQIKKLDAPIVLLWPFKADREPSGIEMELATYMGAGPTLGELASDIANLTDYIIIDKLDKDYVDDLREVGCHVVVEELESEEHFDSLIKSIFNIGSIDIEKANGDEMKAMKVEAPKSDKAKPEVEAPKTEDKSDKEEKRGKRIDQLIESPQEAGESKIKEKLKIDKEEKEDKELIEAVTKEADKTKDEDEKEVVSDVPEFAAEEDEEWNDTVTRAIELLFDDSDDPAFLWLSEQSKVDNDNEVQIATEVISSWLSSRSSGDRKKGAELISKMANVARDTYLQVMQKEMVSAIIDRQEDKRRKLVSMFNLLTEEDSLLSELLIRGLVKQLTMLNDDRAFIHERNKITIVQLVIDSKKLTRVAINELLTLLDKDNTPAAQIWNILTTFDAGNVAIELVTNFSISKADEIIRRANFLRFTGSVYKILQDVLKAWQTGDKSGISEATSEILPEETLRKFDRLELARKVQKLKMVQLTTLAESLGKDVETVERLVTELIVNDELKAEMKLIDDKMYLVSEQEVKQSN